MFSSISLFFRKLTRLLLKLPSEEGVCGDHYFYDVAVFLLFDKFLQGDLQQILLGLLLADSFPEAEVGPKHGQGNSEADLFVFPKVVEDARHCCS